MPLPEWAAADLPPVLAFVAIMGGLALRFFKQRGDQRQSQWDQLRDLVADLRSLLADKDELLGQRDELIENLTADNLRLRRDLKDALRQIEHREDEP